MNSAELFIKQNGLTDYFNQWKAERKADQEALERRRRKKAAALERKRRREEHLAAAQKSPANW